MKKFLLLIFTALITSASYAQMTVTASDMPVSGDTLRYSTTSPIGSTINLGDSGANFTWNYSTLTPVAQAVDTYKTALSVSLTYALISFSAYGYKVADSLPGVGALLPVSINQLYTFFEKKTSPSRYVASAFGAKIAGIATPFNYTTDDVWYFFPLNYQNNDSADYELNIGLSGTASLKQKGYRKSRVDGWGTIVTPYFTTPVNCLRIRSEIHEIDTVNFGLGPIGVPRNTVEYKWLANGEHYPILWVTTNVTGGTETIATIRYRDMARVLTTGVSSVNKTVEIKAYPNPTTTGIVNLDIPSDWQNFHVEVFDMQSKQICRSFNERIIDLCSYPVGVYVAKISNGQNTNYLQIIKQL